MTDRSYDEDKDSAGAVLKTDVLGRVKTSVRQREAMLDEFERSGLPLQSQILRAALPVADSLTGWALKRSSLGCDRRDLTIV